MAGKVVSVTGLGDLKQLEDAFRKAGLVVSDTADKMAESAKRAGAAAAQAAKEQGASADEQAGAAARAAAAFDDAQSSMTRSQRVAAAAAADAAKSAGLNADEQQAAYAKAATAAKESADAQEAAASRSKAAQDSHTKLVGAMSKIGGATVLGLAAGGVAAVKLGMDFESAGARIKGATGQSEAQVKKLTAAFTGTAGHFMESGQSMENAYAGVSGQLKLTEGHALGAAEALRFQAQATDLAEASGSNLTSATSALASTMQAYHLSVSQAAQASDELFNVSKGIGAPVEAVSTAVDKLHARLGVLSPTLADTGALMLDLGKHGITGSRGTQVVNTALQTLVGGSEKTDNVLKALGVSVFNQQGKFVGLQNVIAQLQPKLAGLTQQQQIFAEQTLFGKSAAQIMGQVVQEGAPKFDHLREAVTRTGTAHAAAAAQAHTLKGEWDTLRATLETLGGKLGLVLIPDLQKLGGVLSEGVVWLTKHKAAAEALAAVIGGVLGLAVAVYVSSKAKAFIGATQDMIEGLKALAVRVGISSTAVEGSFAAQAEAATGAAAETAGAEEGLAAKIATSDDAIVASNEAAGASFTAMLGPIGAVVAAVVAAQPEINKLTGGGLGESASNDKNAGKIYEEQYGGKGKQNVLDKGGGIMGYFMSKGLTAAQAAGIAGNVEQESSFNPNAPGGGLFQDIGGRGAGQGAPVSKQLAKAWEELTGPYASVLAELKKAKTPAEAARIFSGSAASGKGFERPGEPMFSNRERYAEEAFRAHPQGGHGGASTAAPSTGSGSAALKKLEEETSKGETSKSKTTAATKTAAALGIPTAVATMLSTAQALLGTKYTSGGGHGSSANDPIEMLKKIGVDCSGFVSRVLSSGGLPTTGLTTEGLASSGALSKGAGRYVTVFDRANAGSNSHTLIDILGHYFESGGTSKYNPKGGVSLLTSTQAKGELAGGGFVAYHPTAANTPVKGGLNSAALNTGLTANEAEASAFEKLIKEREAVIKKAESKGVGTFRKYETDLQTGGVKPLEKLVGTHAQEIYRTYLPKAQQVGTTTMPGGEPQNKEFGQLVASLRATHQKGLEELAAKLVTVHLEAETELTAELKADQETADAHTLALQTTEAKDQTTIVSDMAANIVQAMKDAAQQVADSFSAAATAIKDQTKEMADAASAQVTAIQDQSQITTDKLAERGLYGLNLIAQQQQVGLDEMKVGLDQSIAGAQAVIDQAQTSTDKASAAQQAIVDAVTINQDALIDQAQQNLDNVTKTVDVRVQEAQNEVAKASTGSQAQQQIAQAHLVSAEAAANAAVQEAQATLSAAQSHASQAEQEAQGALASAKGNAEVVLAQAEQALTQAQDQANVSEAEQQAIIEKTKAEASTQYAGSGLVVNITGINPSDSAAVASELGWLMRTTVPAVAPV